MRLGDRVRLRRDVERFPHFIAKTGLTGEIVAFDSEDCVWVLMDAPLPGAEEWDNEILWTTEDNFDADVALVPEGRFANLDF
jgi:hypothetical protein